MYISELFERLARGLTILTVSKLDFNVWLKSSSMPPWKTFTKKFPRMQQALSNPKCPSG